MKLWVRLLGVWGLVGEVVAHVIFPLKTSVVCSVGDLWCNTGIPSAISNPWIFYHVSVHFVLGLAVCLLVLPEQVKKVIHIV
jgi:hypothetical protein